jgi:hypothetical protein
MNWWFSFLPPALRWGKFDDGVRQSSFAGGANVLTTQDYAQVEVPYNCDLNGLEDLENRAAPGRFLRAGSTGNPVATAHN